MREIDLFTNDVDFFKIIRKKFKILNLFTENKKKFKSKLLKRTKIQTIKIFLIIKILQMLLFVTDLEK